VPLANESFLIPQESGVNGLDASSRLCRRLAENTPLEFSNSMIGVVEDGDAVNSNDIPATDWMVLYSSGFPIDHGGDHSFTLSTSFSFAASIRAATQRPVYVQSIRMSSRVSRDCHTNKEETALRIFKDLTPLYSAS
jgi:hypothetical protein